VKEPRIKRFQQEKSVKSLHPRFFIQTRIFSRRSGKCANMHGMKLMHVLPVCLVLFAAMGAAPARAQSPAPTASPYQPLHIESLRAREYGQGAMTIEQTLQVTNAFTRTLVSFDSDGLKVYGFMNTPKGEGPFPVVLVLHGYVNPRAYRTPYTYTQRYADLLARAGFLVIHPDYRGHGRSEGDEVQGNLFRTGYAADVLNLIEYAKRLPNANPNAIGLFGHSMGGGISTRVLAVSDDVKASVLYGSMSADEQANVKQISEVFRGGARIPEQDVPLGEYEPISPMTYLGDFDAAIEIHHGARDNQVPIAWSRDLNEKLRALGKDVTLYEYPRAGHSLGGRDLATMMERVIAFYRETLK
jgi:dipeptidyl aminopeptidase/acylaminoacyl peptidase